MGILNGKTKIDMEEFCRFYYETVMFDEKACQKILNYSFQLLTDSIPSLIKVDRTLFDSELNAMRLELFALAFFQRFNNSNQAIQQSIFTRRYLYEKNKLAIWEAMEHYNRTVAKTATWEMNENTAAMSFINNNRSVMLVRWCEDNIIDTKKPTERDNENIACVARVCNRFGADIVRNDQMGNRQIAGLFLYRIGAENILGKDWEPDHDFGLRLVSISLSAFESAEKIIKSIDLKFS